MHPDKPTLNQFFTLYRYRNVVPSKQTQRQYTPQFNDRSLTEMPPSPILGVFIFRGFQFSFPHQHRKYRCRCVSLCVAGKLSLCPRYRIMMYFYACRLIVAEPSCRKLFSIGSIFHGCHNISHKYSVEPLTHPMPIISTTLVRFVTVTTNGGTTTVILRDDGVGMVLRPDVRVLLQHLNSQLAAPINDSLNATDTVVTDSQSFSVDGNVVSLRCTFLSYVFLPCSFILISILSIFLSRRFHSSCSILHAPSPVG